MSVSVSANCHHGNGGAGKEPGSQRWLPAVDSPGTDPRASHVGGAAPRHSLRGTAVILLNKINKLLNKKHKLDNKIKHSDCLLL